MLQRPPSISFVTCVEAGHLEEQTLRMVTSLRRWGGRYADARVLAVKPRAGPPIRPRYKSAFQDLRVELIERVPAHPYAWYHFLNKPIAVKVACERVDTDYVAWLDGDLLFANEPDQFQLPADVDFAAACTDKNIGTTGPADANDPFWAALARAVGVDLDDLPWVTTQLEKSRIRLYYNAGIFVVRRNSSFAGAYLDACLQALRSKTAHRTSGVYFLEQIVFALTVHREKLRWRELPIDHNFAVASFLADQFDPEGFRQAKIVHLHDSMKASFHKTFTNYFLPARPDIAGWLSNIGPIGHEDVVNWRYKLVRLKRAAARELHLARCKKF